MRFDSAMQIFYRTERALNDDERKSKHQRR